MQAAVKEAIFFFFPPPKPSSSLPCWWAAARTGGFLRQAKRETDHAIEQEKRSHARRTPWTRYTSPVHGSSTLRPGRRTGTRKGSGLGPHGYGKFTTVDPPAIMPTSGPTRGFIGPLAKSAHRVVYDQLPKPRTEQIMVSFSRRQALRFSHGP